jgi:hypothetical protein
MNAILICKMHSEACGIGARVATGMFIFFRSLIEADLLRGILERFSPMKTNILVHEVKKNMYP